MGEVTGQVTMDGKPLPNAMVIFVPKEGGATATGVTDANGNYKLISLDRTGALIGSHTVSITTVKKAEEAPPEVSSDSAEYAKQAMARASDYNDAVVREPIPARYNSKSELVKGVEKGSNVINFELKST
jgi:hypothetical protein